MRHSWFCFGIFAKRQNSAEKKEMIIMLCPDCDSSYSDLIFVLYETLTIVFEAIVLLVKISWQKKEKNTIDDN